MATFCFCNCISDLKPEPFEPLGEDTYQQFEVSRRDNWCGSVDYTVSSVAQDGFPPLFLRRRGWRLHTSTPREFELGEAPGLDSNLRAQLPNFDFSLSDGKSSMPRVVGKWYSPFLFVKESGMNVQDQVIRSRFYEVTLEQQWEPIFRCNNIEENTNSSVDVDVLVEAEAVKVGGSDVVGHLIGVNGGVVWFKSVGKNDHGMEEVVSVGLSKVILERMKWEEERVGWRSGEEGKNRVKKIEEFGGIGMKKWRRFGYFVLAERFVLRRMDGSFVMSYEFNHLHQFRTKWE
ncbi:unnamed protein product [Linum trigynum]|uniref:Uncharacterized protein n=1 Tax=Linum trigynum TaxID=586398 RepID=A0AAV2F2N6_9ROSI